MFEIISWIGWAIAQIVQSLNGERVARQTQDQQQDKKGA